MNAASSAAAAQERDEYTGELLPRAAAPLPPATNDGTEKAAIPTTLFVLDTTAVQGQPPRTHDMWVAGPRGTGKILKSFTFEPGKPLKLPFPVAVRFLAIDAFKHTDEQGNLLPYSRQPKQPEELGAGEKFEIADNQTIARYSELSTMALIQRTVELPGGEAAVEGKDRGRMIDFIIEQKKKKRDANLEKRPARQIAGQAEEGDSEEFYPAAELETGPVASQADRLYSED